MQSPILILGASGGVGAEIARKLAGSSPTPLILHGRDAQRLVNLSAELGAGTTTALADLTDPAAVSQLFAGIGLAHKRLSAVIFSVAAPFRYRLAHNTAWDEFQVQFDAQLKALHLCCTAALPLLASKTETSRLVVVGSEVTLTHPAKTAAYTAAKAAMTSYAQVIAKEWIKKRVRVHIVAPGLMKTSLTDHLPAEFLDQLVETMPEQMLTSTQDVAGVVEFLLTDAADTIYGQPVQVSRGAR